MKVFIILAAILLIGPHLTSTSAVAASRVDPSAARRLAAGDDLKSAAAGPSHPFTVKEEGRKRFGAKGACMDIISGALAAEELNEGTLKQLSAPQTLCRGKLPDRFMDMLEAEIEKIQESIGDEKTRLASIVRVQAVWRSTVVRMRASKEYEEMMAAFTRETADPEPSPAMASKDDSSMRRAGPPTAASARKGSFDDD